MLELNCDAVQYTVHSMIDCCNTWCSDALSDILSNGGRSATGSRFGSGVPTLMAFSLWPSSFLEACNALAAMATQCVRAIGTGLSASQLYYVRCLVIDSCFD